MLLPDDVSMRSDDMVAYHGMLTLGQDIASGKRDEAIEAMVTVPNRFRAVIPRAASRARSAIDSNWVHARSVSASVRNLLAKNPRTAATAAKHNKKRMRPAQTFDKPHGLFLLSPREPGEEEGTLVRLEIFVLCFELSIMVDLMLLASYVTRDVQVRGKLVVSTNPNC
jgi:hypothetical protein